MKKLLLVAFGSLSLSAGAQITVNSTNMITLGDTFLAWEDTIHGPGLDLGAAAGNQVWDFTSLEPHKDDGALLELPNTAPFYLDFPDANLVGNDLYEDSVHIFFKQTSTYLDVVGFVEYDSNGNAFIPEFNPRWRYMQYPATLGTTFGSFQPAQTITEYLGLDPDSTFGPEPFIDSLRNQLSFSLTSEIDAWGDLQLPQGTFETIRQKVYQIVKIETDCYYNGSWQPLTALLATFLDSVAYDTGDAFMFRWWTDNASANFFCAELTLDSGIIDSSVTYMRDAPTWPAGISDPSQLGFEIYPNPTTDFLTIETNATTPLHVRLYDIQLNEVANHDLSDQKISIDLSYVAAGSYLVYITNEQGAIVRMQKIQVLH